MCCCCAPGSPSEPISLREVHAHASLADHRLALVFALRLVHIFILPGWRQMLQELLGVKEVVFGELVGDGTSLGPILLVSFGVQVLGLVAAAAKRGD